MFLLREKFVTQGEKRETSTQNLQWNNVSRQVEGFCISYFAEFTVHANVYATYVPVKSKLQLPPLGQSPGHLNFVKIFVQIPPSPGQKAVQMPPPPEKLPDYCFNFSVASIILLQLCM